MLNTLNTQTNEFLTQLVNLVNASPLPVASTRICLDLVRAQLIEAERAAIEQERQQAEKAKKEQERQQAEKAKKDAKKAKEE